MPASSEIRRPPSRVAAAARVLGILAVLSGFATEARAALLLTLNPETLSAAPGETVVFQGTITNTTGVDLHSTDMFLNFSGFSPVAFADFTQLLGLTDFTLANNRVTGVIDLFSATVASTASNGGFSFDVSLQDINNNESNVVAGAVIVSSAVPEAPSWILASAGGAFALAFAGFRRRIAPRPTEV